jgi:hypothetical protein
MKPINGPTKEPLKLSINRRVLAKSKEVATEREQNVSEYVESLLLAELNRRGIDPYAFEPSAPKPVGSKK